MRDNSSENGFKNTVPGRLKQFIWVTVDEDELGKQMGYKIPSFVFRR